MRNIYLHDCYISTQTGEGAYIGESHYSSVGAIQRGPCASGIKTAKEHEVIGVRIENNIFDGTGADAVQVGAATSGVVITGNTVNEYGSAKVPNQNAGIILNEGTVAEVYNNTINGGYGYAIQMMGPGGSSVHHNLIINAGRGGFGAIMQAIRPVEGVVKGKIDRIYNNTIINATKNGVEYFNETDIRDNVIHLTAGTSYLKSGGSGSKLVADVGNVKVSGNIDQLKLDANYVPLEGSPAFGVVSDAGAFQSIKKPKTIVQPGTLQIETTGTVVEIYAITPDGQKIRLK